MTVPATPSYMTAAEIAAAELPGLPTTRYRVQALAEREGWAEAGFARPRQGRGGGLEYSVQALPIAAREALDDRARAASARAAATAGTVALKRQTMGAATARLTARQRAILDARAAIGLEVDRRMAADGLSRSAAVRAFLDDLSAGRLGRDLASAARAANEKGRGLSRATVLNWLAARDTGGVVALAPGKRQKAPLPGWFDDFLAHWRGYQKAPLTEVMGSWRAAIVARGDDPAAMPTERQVRLALSRIDHLAKAAGREGTLAMRSRQAYVSRDAWGFEPTTIYVADGTTFDAEVSHPIHGKPFRPEITAILDATTRKCVGWSVGLSESFDVVADAFRRGCRHGVPALFYTDRGPGYRNDRMDRDLTGLLARVGTTPIRALPYNSQAKGLVEAFQKRWIALARTFSTYVGVGMDKEAAKAVFRATRRDVALVGTSSILPTWDEFVAAVEAFIADYNARPHRGLPTERLGTRKEHLSPDRAWALKAASGFEPVLLSADEANDLARPWEERVVRRCIVTLATNNYFSTDLDPYHEQRVIVAYDPIDASRVWVRAIDMVDGERQPGQLLAIAQFEGNRTSYVPVSVAEQAIEKRANARLKRLAVHVQEVEDERHGRRFLDGRGALAMVTPAIDVTPAPALPIEVSSAAPVPPARDVVPPDPDQRPRFATDEDFARWCVSHPHRVDRADREYLAVLLASPNQRELFRLTGIDVDAVRQLVRQAA